MRKLILLLLTISLIFINIGQSFAANFPSSTVPNGLGVNISYQGVTSQQMDQIRDAGFKFVRMDLHWHEVETTKGIYNWAKYDNIINGFAQRGIRVLFIVDFNNPLYAATWNTGISTDAQRSGFANFAQAAVSRYKGQGVIWEIWNEPNLSDYWKPAPSASDYMALIKTAIPAMRQADPTATIVAPALASNGQQIDFTYITSLFQQGLLNYVDAVSIHPYSEYSAPENDIVKLQQLRNLIAQYHPSNPNIPIISGERGYSVNWAIVNSEQGQANYLERSFLNNLSMGIPVSIWYEWQDECSDTTNWACSFGIQRLNLTLKPAYQAMQNLSQSLKGMHFVQRLPSSSSDYLLQFTDGVNTKIAAWTTTTAHSVTIGSQSISLTYTPVYITASVPITSQAPTAPSNLIVTGVYKGTTTRNYYVALKWADNSNNETGFQIYQSINSSSNFSLIKSPAANTVTYTINLGNNPIKGTYYYKVVAINAYGTSSPTNIVSVTIK